MCLFIDTKEHLNIVNWVLKIITYASNKHLLRAVCLAVCSQGVWRWDVMCLLIWGLFMVLTAGLDGN